jgi:hypothetical protein
MYECCPSHVVEIESPAALRAHVEEAESLRDVVVQGLDLTDAATEAALTSVPAEDACFLGCRFTDAAEEHVRRTGGTIFPAFVGLPSNPYRSSLYTPDEPMEGYEPGAPETRKTTVDARIYQYFANSIREDGLLAIATYGVLYAPGSAGTIQEVFMDAAQNHFETFGAASPMVFFGHDYWTEEKPVYPLLQTLADGTPYADQLRVTDAVDPAVAAIVDHAPTRAH